MDRFVVVQKMSTTEAATLKRKMLLKDTNCQEAPESIVEATYKGHKARKSGTTEQDEPQIGATDMLDMIQAADLVWKKVIKTNLDLSYTLLFPRTTADALLGLLEKEVEYFTGDLTKVQVFGRWHNIPRKQATYGDPGLTYKYSGKETPGRAWPPVVKAVRDLVCKVTGYKYNFVLINRYKDGQDKIGEHKDDERELQPDTPIASLSLGQTRDFYFRHQDSRPPKKLNIDKVQLQLHHGSLLLMNPPTNRFWYHALPPRASAKGVRVNLTFRKIIPAATHKSKGWPLKA